MATFLSLKEAVTEFVRNGDTVALEAARSRLGQKVDGSQIGSDFERIQKQKENDAMIRRKSENEATERAVRNLAKSLRAGSH